MARATISSQTQRSEIRDRRGPRRGAEAKRRRGDSILFPWISMSSVASAPLRLGTFSALAGCGKTRFGSGCLENAEPPWRQDATEAHDFHPGEVPGRVMEAAGCAVGRARGPEARALLGPTRGRRPYPADGTHPAGWVRRGSSTAGRRRDVPRHRDSKPFSSGGGGPRPWGTAQKGPGARRGRVPIARWVRGARRT